MNVPVGVKGQTATGADSHDGEAAELVFFHAGREIYVGACVELIEHDVDIVASDACALHGDSLSFVIAGDGVELTVLHVTFYPVKETCHLLDTAWVAYQDDFVSEKFWFEVKVKDTAVRVDD